VPRKIQSWASISLPREVVENVEKIVENDPFFVSVSEFVRAAIRAKIEFIEAAKEGS